MKSFIRWAGSKKQILSTLRQYWPGGRVKYIEPFCGSASLFFALQPTDSILADLNPDLIGAMRAVKRDVGRVVECLRRLPKGKNAYYRVRKNDPALLSHNERAARFIYLNRYCFNGLYRTNAAGLFNVPYGDHKGNLKIDESTIIEAATLLSNAQLVCGDFEETLALAQKGDFVYLDPPYVTEKRRVFSEYTPGSFTVADLRRLAASLKRLDRRRVTFIITYAYSAESRELLGEWNTRRVKARRHIAGFAGARRGAYELIATNLSN